MRCKPTKRVGHDQQRVLAAGIIGSQHDEIRESSRDLSHARPLRAVAFSPATKEHYQAVVGEFARGLQDIFQRVIRMGIIHHHQKGLPLVDAFESPRDRLKLGDAFLNL